MIVATLVVPVPLVTSLLIPPVVLAPAFLKLVKLVRRAEVDIRATFPALLIIRVITRWPEWAIIRCGCLGALETCPWTCVRWCPRVIPPFPLRTVMSTLSISSLSSV